MLRKMGHSIELITGAPHLKGEFILPEQVRVSAYPQIGILSSIETTLPGLYKPVRTQTCSRNVDILYSLILLSELGRRQIIPCYFDDELNAYCWIRDEEGLKDSLRTLIEED